MRYEIEKIKSRLKVGSYCFQMLCYLEQGGTFTVWEARDLFGCTSTLARVAELRGLGAPIVSTPEDNHVRYSLGGGSSMTRDEKLCELRMLVLGYMQVEDKKKAAEAFMKWQAALKGVE